MKCRSLQLDSNRCCVVRPHCTARLFPICFVMDIFTVSHRSLSLVRSLPLYRLTTVSEIRLYAVAARFRKNGAFVTVSSYNTVCSCSFACCCCWYYCYTLVIVVRRSRSLLFLTVFIGCCRLTTTLFHSSFLRISCFWVFFLQWWTLCGFCW